MSSTPPIVTIFGGSGFVGRYIANRMARQGWRVRVAVRRPNEALFVRTYGVVGQVEPILANVRDRDSVKRAIDGADAVVDCVGILQETSRQKFNAIHSEAAGRIASIAAAAGVKRLVHISAIGADENSESAYARSKAKGEAAVRHAFPDVVILRPSVVFGTEDRFFNRFAAIARMTRIVPLVGADSKFQPVYVDDVAAAAERALTSDVPAGIYELGGPDVETLRDLAKRMLKVIERKALVINLPLWYARLLGWVFDMASKMTGGLMPAMITRDQVKLLQYDNVVAEDARTLDDLGIKPTAMDAILEDYLYAFRPGGQYTEIVDSARNLRVGKG